jgi:hypothetical protein
MVKKRVFRERYYSNENEEVKMYDDNKKRELKLRRINGKYKKMKEISNGSV